MYLITGGLGFIGNELARQLAPSGAVHILDNRSRAAQKIEDLERVPVYEVDLLDTQELKSAIDHLRPKIVFHLAAIHYIPECNADPQRTLRVNVEATHALADICSKSGVEHFLFASSGAVYADSHLPLKESSPLAPVDIYGWSKLFSENICEWIADQSKMKTTALRLFNNYGPRETNPHIIPEIISQVRKGNTLQLGNIKPRRDYIYTEDTASALRAVSARPPSKSYQTVNIASGCHASVEELIEIMSHLLGRELRVEVDPGRFRRADKLMQVADISILREKFAWQPSFNLERGMRQLLNFENLIS